MCFGSQAERTSDPLHINLNYRRHGGSRPLPLHLTISGIIIALYPLNLLILYPTPPSAVTHSISQLPIYSANMVYSLRFLRY